MKLGSSRALILVALSASFAAPSVVVSTNCSSTTCTGGVQPGSVTTQGVLSLDVYASATAASVLPPEPIGQLADTFDISVGANLHTAGSGPGVLVIDPTYTFAYSQPYDAILEAVSVVVVNGNFEGACLRFGVGVSQGGAVCSGEMLEPITLGSDFTLSLDESNELFNDIPATSSLTTDLNLWAISPTGNIIPVTLAAESVPEPANFTMLGLGGLMCLVRIRRRRARHVNSDLNFLRSW